MRRAGVLLHVTALPGTPACGTFGAAAHKWVDALASQGIQAWQVLPLAPTDGLGSPYSAPSAFALNPWFLDADALVQAGLLAQQDLNAIPSGGQPGRLDFDLAKRRSAALAEALLQNYPSWDEPTQQAFAAWREQQRYWLVDHCRFVVLRQLHEGQPWWSWPAALAGRKRSALKAFDQKHGPSLLQEALLQWQLQQQWQAVLDHARRCGVQVIGDIPFYVAHDSADVWSHRRLFSLDRSGRLLQQSGVPPDYFSETGQLWGTPVYRWPLHRLSRFRWWRRRLRRQLQVVDLLRIDHFRALEAAWIVPGGDDTAERGVWKQTPGASLLRLLPAPLPLIAEDLGVITPEVEALRDRFALPGMKILQFAFDGNPGNPYLPSNIEGERWVVYTGTHDNATCIGWWQQLSAEQRTQVEALTGPVHAPGWQLLELALATSAGWALVPLQDLLHLGDEARFNTPGTTDGNWQWRLGQSIASLAGPLQGYAAMARRYGRGG